MYIKTMAVSADLDHDGFFDLKIVNGNLDEYFFCADSMSISHICGCKVRRMVGDDSLSKYCLVSLTNGERHVLRTSMEAILEAIGDEVVIL